MIDDEGTVLLFFPFVKFEPQTGESRIQEFVYLFIVELFTQIGKVKKSNNIGCIKTWEKKLDTS